MAEQSARAAIGGRISANGKVLAFLVSREATGEWPPGSRAWQVFTKTGSDWLPTGPALHREWMNVTNRSEWGALPWVVSDDGRMAWTLLEGSGSLPDLVSVDLASGESQKWFTAEDLLVDPDSLEFATLVPSS